MIEMWTCKCGYQNPILARYCPHCGLKIPDNVFLSIAKKEITHSKKEYLQLTFEKSEKRVIRLKILNKYKLGYIAMAVIIFTMITANEHLYALDGKDYQKIVSDNAEMLWDHSINVSRIVQNMDARLEDAEKQLETIMLDNEYIKDQLDTIGRDVSVHYVEDKFRQRSIVVNENKKRIIRRIDQIVDYFK